MKRSSSPILIAKLASVPIEQQFTSSITLGELVYDARRIEARTDVLLERLESVLLPNLPILPFAAAAAHVEWEQRNGVSSKMTQNHRRFKVSDPLNVRCPL
jgi:predicted nucleic acid-binding protein